MPDSRGYGLFDTYPVLEKTASLIIDGYTIKGTLDEGGFVVDQEGAGWVLDSYGGAMIYQLEYRGPDQPVNMSPLSVTVQMLFKHEDDISRLEMAAWGGPVLFVPHWPAPPDQWLIAAKKSGQTKWRTSRRLSYGLSGITHATHPPRAWIDGTEQTIVTAAPIAGEVQVPTTQTANQNYEEITTVSTITGNRLRFLYWPEYLVTFSRRSSVIPVFNGWVWTGQLREFFAGVYTP